MRRTTSVVLALAVFAAMWFGYTADWSWLDAVDGWALVHAADIASARPGWVTFWDVLCTVFGPLVFRVVGAAVIVVAVVRRDWRTAVFVLLTVELSGVVTQIAKWLADRARPETAMVHAMGTSFPSGHALAVVATAVAVGTLIGVRSPRHRLALVVAVTAVVVLVGFGRVALNVHHPSDVVAGWALGYAYAMTCLLMLRPTPITTRPISVADGTPATPGSAR